MKSLFNIVHRSLLSEAQSGKGMSAGGNDACAAAAAGRALLLTAVAAAATGEVLPMQRRNLAGAGVDCCLDSFTILAVH